VLGRSCRLRAGRPRPPFRRRRQLQASRIGRINDAAFFANLRKSLGVDLTDGQFLEAGTRSSPARCRIAPTAAAAAKRMPLYAFSNTNPAHVAHFSVAYAGLLSHFRTVFLSSSIGFRKPDAEAMIMW